MLPLPLAGHSIARVHALAVSLEGTPIPDDPEEVRLECSDGAALRVRLASDGVRMLVDADDLSEPYGVVEHLDMSDHPVLRALVGRKVAEMGTLKRRARSGVIGVWIKVDQEPTVHLLGMDFGIMLTASLPTQVAADIVLAPWEADASDG